jgi:hypothetical protein
MHEISSHSESERAACGAPGWDVLAFSQFVWRVRPAHDGPPDLCVPDKCRSRKVGGGAGGRKRSDTSACANCWKKRCTGWFAENDH